MRQSFFVSPDLPFDAILGSDFLSTTGISVDCRHQRLTLPNNTTIQLERCRSIFHNTVLPIVEPTEESQFPLDNGVTVHDLVADVDPVVTAHSTVSVNSELEPTQRQQIQDILQEFADVFKPASGDSPCNFPPFRLNTGNATPISSRPYRIP